MTTDHQQLRELLGAYALDQLDDRTRTSVRTHLDHCADCPAELAGLVPVAQALRGLDPAELAAGDPPPHLVDQVVAHVARRQQADLRRSRLRRGAAGVLAAAALAVAFATGSWYADSRGGPPVEYITLQASTADVQADAGLVRHTWGTELKLEATGLEPGTSYTVTFVGDDGSRVSGGTFLGTGARPVVCSVNAAIARDAATALTITDPGGGVVMQAQLG